MMIVGAAIGTALGALILAPPAMAGQHDHAAKKAAKVCREDRSTGSIMPTRICHSAEEWAAIDGRNNADARDTMEHVGQPTNQIHR